MGSLMAGWDSHVQDPKLVSLERNKSFTKEEIEAFWRLHKESKQHDQQQEASFGSFKYKSEEAEVEYKGEGKEEASSPNSDRFVFAGTEYPVDLEKAIKTGDWWTRSNWAFLNEPPREEKNESSNKYAAQYHVAQLATSTNKWTRAH